MKEKLEHFSWAYFMAGLIVIVLLMIVVTILYKYYKNSQINFKPPLTQDDIDFVDNNMVDLNKKQDPMVSIILPREAGAAEPPPTIVTKTNPNVPLPEEEPSIGSGALKVKVEEHYPEPLSEEDQQFIDEYYQELKNKGI